MEDSWLWFSFGCQRRRREDVAQLWSGKRMCRNAKWLPINTKLFVGFAIYSISVFLQCALLCAHSTLQCGLFNWVCQNASIVCSHVSACTAVICSVTSSVKCGYSVYSMACSVRHDICHKHRKRRLCKIISTRVKFYFVNVFLEHGCVYHFGFW